MTKINYAKTKQFMEAINELKASFTEDDIAELSTVLYKIVDRMVEEGRIEIR